MWSSDDVSERRARLPDDWDRADGPRARVLARDGHACQWPMPGRRCGARASHVDHIEPGTTGSVPDHELWALCAGHHTAKTAAEGGRAKAARYRVRRPHARVHPGVTERDQRDG